MDTFILMLQNPLEAVLALLLGPGLILLLAWLTARAIGGKNR